MAPRNKSYERKNGGKAALRSVPESFYKKAFCIGGIPAVLHGSCFFSGFTLPAAGPV